MQQDYPAGMDLSAHKHWLSDHVSAKIASAKVDPEPLSLKLAHTMRVLDNAGRICASEKLAPDLARACALAALYHDLSRFDQYLIYGTFKDRDSRNHGAWSVKLLKREKRLEDEPARIKRTALIAVGMHNRLKVPATIRGDTLLACNLVRDADKIDIVRVMAEHLAKRPYNPTVVLGLPDDPDLASEKTIADALSGRPASYSDLRSVNDFRLLLGTWLFGMNFASSRKIFVESGCARRIMEELPASYGRARERILRLLA